MRRFILILFSFLLCSSHAHATLDIAIPEPLQPWKGWVLHDEKFIDCVTPYNNNQNRLCIWQSNLKLDLTETEGTFSFNAQTDAKGFVTLPGNLEYWPQQVKVGDKLAAVINRDNLPHIYLMPGNYIISGQFNYERIPQILVIPKNMAIVSLTIQGKLIENIKRHQDGSLWLGTTSDAKDSQKEDSLTIQVYRLFQDTIPMQSQTLLRLKITGQTREVNLGNVLLSNQVPVAVRSAIPAQIDKNGDLKLQVTSGMQDVTVDGRFLEPTNKITFESRENWPKEEIWSFESQNDLRLVEIQGGQSIDPQQSAVPEAWMQYPTYLLKPGQSLNFTEKRRGQELHRYEDITLFRKMWLDFSGANFTVVDELQGNLESSWRLSVQPPYALGRVSINGKDMLITELENKKEPGVEIRQGQLNLLAVSRIIRSAKLPAIGWNLDVKKLSTYLYFPPGWLLIDVIGADSVTNAWLRDWSLLDFFLLLIIAASAWKLLGLGWGLLVALTLVLIYREPNAPVYSWLNLIAAIAVFQVLPKGKVEKFIGFYIKISFVVLLIIALPFIVQQVRVGIYPQLKGPIFYPQVSYPQEGAAPAPMSRAAGMMGASVQKSEQMLLESKMQDAVEVEPLPDYAPDAKIQTGPGIPEWQWSLSQINWSGPVVKDQTITLYFIPRWLNSILKFLQVILIGVLIYGLGLRLRQIANDKDMTRPPAAPTTVTASVLLAMLLGLFALLPQNSYADFPTPKLLQDLKQRLLEPHECYPDCAAISKMQVEAQDDALTLRLSVQNSIRTAVPMPNSGHKWLPQTVLVDGVQSDALQIDNQDQLWIRLEAGSHEIVLQGSLYNIDELELNLPLKPHLVLTQLNLWEQNGIVQQRLLGNNLYLKRVSTGTAKLEQFAGQSTIPPFAIFERTINLGFDWQITNRIQRIAPPNQAMQFTIPLIKGERVLSNNVQAQDNKVFVSLSENQSEITWTSKLDKESVIHLEAVKNNAIKEIWYLSATPEWHLEFDGIPMVHQQNKTGRWNPSWQPWPGELLQIAITRPQSLPGNTLTIDSAALSLAPGKRATDNTLDTTIRSSQGTIHLFQLPEKVQIQDVLIDGLSQPINIIQRNLRIPIHPGTQNVTVKWRKPEGIDTFFKTPEVSLNTKSTNNKISIGLNQDRWVLFLGGPLIGPAVLYWGILLVVLMVSIFIPRFIPSPLSAWQWFLLGAGSLVASPLVIIIILFWFFAVYQRSKVKPDMNVDHFKWFQVGLVVLTFLFIVSLFSVVSAGLLGSPQMQISAPQLMYQQVYSLYPTARQMQWYQDISNNTLPTAWIISLPMYVYRTLMLLWALWLAFSLVKWLRWGWQNFSKYGLWNLNKAL